MDCTNHRFITLAESETVKEEKNQEEKKDDFDETQEENQEEIEEKASEGEMVVLKGNSSGFQGDEHE